MQIPIQLVTSDLSLLSTVPLHLSVLMVFLLTATVIDVRVRRIPNPLVAAGMVVAILFHLVAEQGAGLTFALSGAGIGMLVFFPFYALGAMGAGDVKLMGMIGAFLGVNSVLGAILATMAAGGVFALGIGAYKRLLPQLLANLRLMLTERHIKQIRGPSGSAIPASPSVGKMPYAVAILAGTLIQLCVLHY